MALSAFADKSRKPRPSDLKKTLGRTSTHWDNLITHLAAEHSPLEETWLFSGPQWGWSLRLKQKKRAILYLTPCKGYFHAGFALGERAVNAAREGHLPAPLLAAIEGAQKFAEGRAVRIEIRNKKDLENARKLAEIKMAN
jgi:hypothetical protein